jgi:hypothetical protein
MEVVSRGGTALPSPPFLIHLATLGEDEMTRTEIKQKITELKAQKAKAREASDPKKVNEARRTIHRLRRRLRKASAAEKAKPAEEPAS